MLKLIAIHFRLGALHELQYRVNFWIQILQSSLSLGSALGALAVVFGHTQALAGWQPLELVALSGVYFTMNGFIGAIVQPSMERFLQDIRLGTLDFVLTKPRDSQLLVSIRRVSIWSLLDVLLGVVVLAVALVRLHRPIHPAQALAFVVVLAAGAVHRLQLLADPSHARVLVRQDREHPVRVPEHVSGGTLAGRHLSEAVAAGADVPGTGRFRGDRAGEAAVGRLEPRRSSWRSASRGRSRPSRGVSGRYGVRHYSGASA